jgi:hypothetical protein
VCPYRATSRNLVATPHGPLAPPVLAVGDRLLGVTATATIAELSVLGEHRPEALARSDAEPGDGTQVLAPSLDRRRQADRIGSGDRGHGGSAPDGSPSVEPFGANRVDCQRSGDSAWRTPDRRKVHATTI